MSGVRAIFNFKPWKFKGWNRTHSDSVFRNLVYNWIKWFRYSSFMYTPTWNLLVINVTKLKQSDVNSTWYWHWYYQPTALSESTLTITTATTTTAMPTSKTAQVTTMSTSKTTTETKMSTSTVRNLTVKWFTDLLMLLVWETSLFGLSSNFSQNRNFQTTSSS